VVLDGSDGLWLAVVGRGLLHWDRSAWVEYDRTNSGLQTDSPSCVAVSPTGLVWVGSIEIGPPGGVYRFDGSAWTHWNLATAGLGGVNDLELDRDGRPWVGTSTGPGYFDGTAWVRFGWGPVNDTPALLKDAAGNMWVGTVAYGLGKWDGVSWTVYTTANSGLPSNYITSLAQAADGALWIGTCSGGIVRFDGATWTAFTTKNSGIAADYCIEKVFLDRLGNTWVGSEGVSVYRQGGVETGIDPLRAPARTRLLANVPNPFNPSTTIRYELARPQMARLAVHDVRGRLLRSLHNGVLGAGEHVAQWDGRDFAGRAMASGVYVVRLVTDDGGLSRKIVLVR
jgi:streptogramin lyase